MSGGIHRGPRNRCARRLGVGLLGGLCLAPAVSVPALAGDQLAAPAPIVDDDCDDRPVEQSIIVRPRQVDPDEAVALVSDQPDADALQPIANVSACEPELADAPAVDDSAPQVPTLADPPPGADADQSAATASPAAAPPIEIVSFNGVTPGVTTRRQLLDQWGEPASQADNGQVLTYRLESFPSVTVSLFDDHVNSVCIELAEPMTTEELVGKLNLTGLRPHLVRDDFGVHESTSFPERGVILKHAAAANEHSTTDAPAADPAVVELVVRPIEAAAFLRRAEAAAPLEMGGRIADLESALELDGANVATRAALAELKLATGAAATAEKLAAEVVELAPKNSDYRLLWARCLKYLARYEQAFEQTRLVLESDQTSQLTRARALEQMALLAAFGSREVQLRTLPFHKQAIQLADELATNENDAVRIGANQLLVNAHLAVAERIAMGTWDGKEPAVSQWMQRASSLAEEMIAAGEADVSLRLQVAMSGLAAGGKLNPPLDPAPWIAEAEEAVADLVDAGGVDQLARDQLNWQLGLAYYQAVEIQHRRGDATSALKFGDQAVATLTPLAAGRRELPDTDYVLGRMNFQIGAVHAVHHEDHDLACQWYDKAVDALLEPVPLTELATPGQHGDALVSMGVSYWQVGDRQQAYKVTQAGAELVEQGIDDGVLTAKAASVARSNLTAMGQALGKASAFDRDESGNQVAEQQPASNKRTKQSQQLRSKVQTADSRGSAGATAKRR